MPRALIERCLCGSRRIVHVRLSVLSQALPDGRPCQRSVCRLGLAVAKLSVIAGWLLPAFLSVAASSWLSAAGISQCCRILLGVCCRHFSVLPHLAGWLLPAFLSVAASCWLAGAASVLSVAAYCWVSAAGISQFCRILLGVRSAAYYCRR